MAACTTIPRYDSEELKRIAVSALPGDHAVYLYMNALSCSEIVTKTAGALSGSSDQIAEVLEVTEDILISASALEAETAEWVLIGTGRFPIGAYSTALNFNRGWKRIAGGGRRWISEEGFELALPEPHLIVAASPEARIAVERLGDLPADSAGNGFYGLLAEYVDRDVVAYAIDPGGMMPFELPPGFMDGCTAAILGNCEGDAFILELLLRFPSQAKARIAGMVLRTVLISEEKRGDGMLTGANVTVDEVVVTIGPIEIDSTQIVEYAIPMIPKGGWNR